MPHPPAAAATVVAGEGATGVVARETGPRGAAMLGPPGWIGVAETLTVFAGPHW